MPSSICRSGIPFFHINHYLLKVPIFRLSFSSTSTPKISLFDYLVNHHNFSPECAAKVSSSSSTKYINKPQNADSVLNFLKETGFSMIQIEALVGRAPRFLSADVETNLKPKIKVFHDLGFHSSDFVHIISTSPRILTSSAERIRLSILGLKNVLGHNADICSLLKKPWTGWVVGYDLNTTLVPNIEYLNTCGICPFQIASFVSCSRTTFFTKPDKLKGIVERVDEMGVDRQSKMFLYAVRVMASMSRKNWELKLKLFRELGFSEQHISHAFRASPQAFEVSEKKIKEVTQLLLTVDGWHL